ncbi:MAG: rhodanese-like domain-containing protein [Anaerolineales bacterium]|jgi:3-mercaptopyruvate sulfurtransferase SseA|nr:rhodanese-like domain-containing protein [Anaerolineales bacterium]
MKKRKNQKSPVPLFFALGGGLLLIAAAILLANQNAPAAPTPVTSHEEETYPEIPRVSLNDANAALEEGTAVVVDVRSVEAYQAAHVTGAINIPLAELETRLTELDQAQWIITYCT